MCCVLCAVSPPPAHARHVRLGVAGVNDDAKRRLLTAAVAYMQGAGDAVEQERLSEWDRHLTVTSIGCAVRVSLVLVSRDGC